MDDTAKKQDEHQEQKNDGGPERDLSNGQETDKLQEQNSSGSPERDSPNGQETGTTDVKDVDIEQSVSLAVSPDEDDQVEDEDQPEFEELKDDSVEGFFKHQGPVYCARFNPRDESLVVTSGGDDIAYVWDIEDGEQAKYKFEGHTDTVTACAYSFDAKYIATASMDCMVRLYDGTSGEFLRTLEGPAGEIEWIDWHPRGPALLAGSADTTVWMWDAETGKCVHVFAGHLGPVLCGGFTSDGKSAFSGSEDGSAIIWNPKKGTSKHHFKGNMFHDGPLNCIACHPSRSVLLTGSQDSKSMLINAKTGKILMKIECHNESVESVGFSNTNTWIATGGLDGLLSVWDTNSSQCRIKCVLKGGIVKLKWHPTSPLIFAGGLDQTIQLWDTRNGSVVKTWFGHQSTILDFDVSSDGSKIISGSDDCAALVFKYG